MHAVRAVPLLSLCLWLGLSCLAARADDLPPPEGDIVLTVTGAIARTNLDGTAVFDLEMLKQLPPTSFSTTTIWTEGDVDFRGVLLADLLDAVAAEATTIHAVSATGTAVKIPTSDAVIDGPIVAYAMNGKPLAASDQGPLWIVYPYDSDRQYRTEQIYRRSIQHLESMDIR